MNAEEELMKSDYKSVVSHGCVLMYKNVNLCDLRYHVDYLNRRQNGMYQVHSDNPRFKCSEIYYNIDEAVNRFIEVKLLVR